jgi:hypothetical protein
MKREVKRFYFGVTNPDKGTIIIDKNGMRVEGIEGPHAKEDDIIKALIEQAIDSGSWQHSRHLDIGKAQARGSAERKKIRKILEEKIEQAKQLEQMLRDAKQVLSRWHY